MGFQVNGGVAGVSPIATALPSLSTWEQRMVSEAHGIATDENSVYYDYGRVLQQVRSYTGDPATYTPMEDAAISKFMSDKFGTGYRLAEGWWAFPHGLYYHWFNNGTYAAAARDTLIGYSTNPDSAYQSPWPAAAPGEPPGWPNADGEFHVRVSRENAYYLQSYLYAERAGQARLVDPDGSGIAHAHRRVEMAANHLRQWKNDDYTQPSSSNSFCQTFMLSLTLYALIDVVKYLREIGEDENQWWPYPAWQTHLHDWPVVEWPTITDAIIDMTRWMFDGFTVREEGHPDFGKPMLISTLGLDGQGGYDDSGGLVGSAFRYVDRSYSSGSPGGADPDLNLLILGPVGWAGLEAGDSTFFTARGDALFQGGAEHAYMAGNFGKTYNQCYLKSFDYVAARNSFGT